MIDRHADSAIPVAFGGDAGETPRYQMKRNGGGGGMQAVVDGLSRVFAVLVRIGAALGWLLRLPFIWLAMLVRKISSAGPSKVIELFVATVALGIAAWSNLKSNAVTERLAHQQMRLQQIADDHQHADNLIAIINSGVQLIDLDTSSGRAALSICLRAALSLNESGQRNFDYRALLPRYREERLVESLAEKDPDLLKAMLKYGLRPEDPPTGAEEMYYVVVETYVHPDRDTLALTKYRLRAELNANSVLRDLSISMLNLAGRAESFAMVIGTKSRGADANYVIATMKKSGSSFHPYRLTERKFAPKTATDVKREGPAL